MQNRAFLDIVTGYILCEDGACIDVFIVPEIFATLVHPEKFQLINKVIKNYCPNIPDVYIRFVNESKNEVLWEYKKNSDIKLVASN